MEQYNASLFCLLCYKFHIGPAAFLHAVWAGFNYSSLVAVYKGLQGDGQPDSPAGAFLPLFCGRAGNILL